MNWSQRPPCLPCNCTPPQSPGSADDVRHSALQRELTLTVIGSDRACRTSAPHRRCLFDIRTLLLDGRQILLQCSHLLHTTAHAMRVVGAARLRSLFAPHRSQRNVRRCCAVQVTIAEHQWPGPLPHLGGEHVAVAIGVVNLRFAKLLCTQPQVKTYARAVYTSSDGKRARGHEIQTSRDRIGAGAGCAPSP